MAVKRDIVTETQRVRVPPQDTEAEASVLGAILLDKDAMWRIADILSSRDFYKREHERIFEVVSELFAKGDPIDVLSVTSRLKEKNELDSAGGPSYLASLANAVPSASHAVHYARIVQR